MKIDRDFLIKLPKNVQDFLNHVIDQGFTLTLVGGAVRDYLLTHTICSDLDFEIRHPDALSGQQWEKRLKDLNQHLFDQFHIKGEVLPYSIFRYQFGETSLEFSSPRTETFTKAQGHKNFKAALASDLPYKESFSRRDFTINAMGISITHDQVVFVDPFDGYGDLKKKVLRPCGKNFTKDPVRFLRLLRFKLTLGFKMDDDLERSLKQFKLNELTTYYFFYEGFKTDFALFLHDFFELVNKYQLHIPEKLQLYKKVSELKLKKIRTKEDLLVSLIIAGELPLVEDVAESLQIKKNLLQRLLRHQEYLDMFTSLSEKVIKSEVTTLDESSLLGKDYIKLFDLYSKNKARLPQAYLDKSESVFFDKIPLKVDYDLGNIDKRHVDKVKIILSLKRYYGTN